MRTNEHEADIRFSHFYESAYKVIYSLFPLFLYPHLTF